MIYIGMDDTDNAQSRGTGLLARNVADALSGEFEVLGVIRHQLLKDPRVPCTKNNSCKGILVDADHAVDLDALFERVAELMLSDFIEGSDPGLCIANTVPADVVAFGRRAQSELVTQEDARQLAAAYGIRLRGLGGDEMGVIGALASVGLTAGGEDGRYIQCGQIRGLSGLLPVAEVVAAGVAAVQTIDGQPVSEGPVAVDHLRPARRQGRPIAVVEWQDNCWMPVKLN